MPSKRDCRKCGGRCKKRAPEFFAGKHPRVMAHRGASLEFPENTLPAFARAVEVGADILESDAQLTADGHIVLFHDDVLDRVTNGTGTIAEHTLAELKALDAGWSFSRDGGKTFPFRGKGITICTLEEFQQAFPDKPLNIDIKHNNAELIRKVLLTLEMYGRIKHGNVLVASFHHEVTEDVRRFSSEIITAGSPRENKFMLAKAWGKVPFLGGPAQALQVPVKRNHVTVVTPRFVKAAHAAGMEVHVWTVDDEQEMKRLLAMGVDGLFTNDPALMRRVVDERAWA